ncbi:hypothetical protein Hbl1158_05615 [Halobaculum sp. CBA1158]|uniref:DUF7331 family protein n=1 Tax=Halobaculum sp. CBA1158 TaxID=2904243 RepID=UPI001F1C9552|nr:hypothetical protein [Halobaculum sp. CBA1158]UIP00834.1 hypothetical protein Hbl1158_05615 [Halobaculum sp. CBA1158]
MTHATDTPLERSGARPEEAVETVEAYEDDGRTVFYDAENPLAWVEAGEAVNLTEAV